MSTHIAINQRQGLYRCQNVLIELHLTELQDISGVESVIQTDDCDPHRLSLPLLALYRLTSSQRCRISLMTIYSLFLFLSTVVS